jgi:hypothetical protein
LLFTHASASSSTERQTTQQSAWTQWMTTCHTSTQHNLLSHVCYIVRILYANSQACNHTLVHFQEQPRIMYSLLACVQII